MRDTDRDWEKVAEERPYYGVISDDRFLGRDLDPSERNVFYESADGPVEHIFSVIRSHLAPDFAPERSLEFGCGVGRMLVPIARRSGEAIGVDVAPRMLELARRHLRESNVTNARVVRPHDPLLRQEAVFDFVNSFIVLQHIPPQRGYEIILDLLRLLKPGGVAALHVSFARGRPAARFPVKRYARRDGAAVFAEGPFEPLLPVGTISVYDYDLNQIVVFAAEAGMAPIIVFPTGDHEGHLGAYLYMRKPE